MRYAALALLAICVALPAAAQPAPTPTPKPTPYRDLIGELINPGARPPRDEDEPDTAGQPRTAQDVEPSLVARPGQAAPPAASPPVPLAPRPRPQLDAPVYINQTGKTPDAPPAVRDLAYDSRIRASFAAAEGFQGPLDGGWTLVSADGKGLFALQLVDRRDRLEGVWRDLRRKGAIDASGLVDDIQRQGSELSLRFAAEPGKPATVATLHGAAEGWSGDLSEGGQSRRVTLRRTTP